ncbi:MAG: hypothetical protein AMS23_02115 [Bacteroides sp. SM1_62]|nr:MAG: hypothetical protein AMS26_08775 [Bacteroides sp. SM23_62]KPL26357.1 MAG: hypothetical protein AMS23_02115 [Bacteroides sp. SM1_62]
MDVHDFLIGDDKIAIRVLNIDKVRHIINQGIKQLLFIKELLFVFSLLLCQCLLVDGYPFLTDFFIFGFQTSVFTYFKQLKESPGITW